MNEDQRILENLRLDCENRHIKNYFDGYRESMLTLIHGEDAVSDVFDIDVQRHSPDSPTEFSYNEGWLQAVNDYQLKSK